jgi:hypothetical protein
MTKPIHELVADGEDEAVNMIIEDLAVTGVFTWLENHATVLELDRGCRPCRWKVLDAVLECDYGIPSRAWRIDGDLLPNQTNVRLRDWLRSRVLDFGIVVKL